MSSLEYGEGVFRLSSFWFLLCQVVCSKHRSYVVWAVHRQGFVSRVKSRHVHRDWFQMSARIMNLNSKSGPQWFTSMNPSNDKDTWKCSNIIHTSVVTYFFFYPFEVSMLSNRVHGVCCGFGVYFYDTSNVKHSCFMAVVFISNQITIDPFLISLLCHTAAMQGWRTLWRTGTRSWMETNVLKTQMFSTTAVAATMKPPSAWPDVSTTWRAFAARMSPNIWARSEYIIPVVHNNQTRRDISTKQVYISL